MAYSFRGGVHPDGCKTATAGKTIELLKAPSRVVLPMSMHAGAPCIPVVKTGDHVFLGQLIADSDAPVSVPIHATVSGTVSAVEPRPHPNGTKVLSIVIDNDFQDELDPAIHPVNADLLSPEEIIKAVRKAGIVGHGGAMFPTHIKISSSLGKVDTLIINCAECEPYVTSDHRILLEYSWEVIGGAIILRRLFGVTEAKLAIEQNKENTYPILRQYLPSDDSIKIYPLITKYPQGSEKQLISALTGCEVPSGKLPADVGAVVFNADTCAAIYRLFATGMPMVRRIVTVSGSAISNPKNLECRIGTPISALIEACGDFLEPPNKLLMGGPMMGLPLFSLEMPVIKGTNAILAFCQDEYIPAKHPACIRCGRCVDVCPMRLMPTYIYMCSEKGTVADLESYDALDCIECGACAYACPAKLPLVQGIRSAKQRVMDARRKK